MGDGVPAQPVRLPAPRGLSQREWRVKGHSGTPAVSSRRHGHLSPDPPHSLPAASPGRGSATRTWEFSYLFRAGCVLCCVPTEVSKCPDELADFKGDCSAALQPSFGGAVFCLPAPHTGWAPHIPGLFSCSRPPFPAGLSQQQRCEVAGVNSCLGGRFRPFFVWSRPLGSPTGRGLQCPAGPLGALCRQARQGGWVFAPPLPPSPLSWTTSVPLRKDALIKS